MGIPGLVPALIGAGSNLLGGLLGESSAEDAAEEQFEHQKELMEIQHNYQVSDYQHRHQWETQDLLKAGLNPILSANSGASVAGVSAGTASMRQTPTFDFSKAIEQLTNSAKSSQEAKLLKFNAETDRIKADADMLRARQDEAKTQSAIELNQSQSSLNMKNVEMLDKNYSLQKMYMEANVREIDQRIINSVMEVNAKVQYYKDTGEAAKTSAAAAMQSANAQAVIAQVAEANGISQRQLNDALTGKASAETKEAYERALQVQTQTGMLDWQKQKDMAHNPLAVNPGLGSMFMEAGEILRNGIGGSVNWSFH